MDNYRYGIHVFVNPEHKEIINISKQFRVLLYVMNTEAEISLPTLLTTTLTLSECQHSLIFILPLIHHFSRKDFHLGKVDKIINNFGHHEWIRSLF